MPDSTPTRPPDPARLTAQRIARILLAAVLIALGLYVLGGFLRALAWAAVLAVATWPLYARLEHRARPAAAIEHGEGHNILLPLLFTLATTLVVLVPIVLLAVQAGREAHTIADLVRNARDNGVPLPDQLAHLPAFQTQISAWWAANLANPDDARATLGRLDQELMGIGRTYGSRIVRTAADFSFTMLALFFLYRDGRKLAGQLLDAATHLFGHHGERVARQMVASIHGTVDGLVLVGLGVGVILGVGYLVAGIPHPALLGAATAVAAMIPMGAWIMLAIACLLALAAGKSAAAAILAIVGVVVIFGADHFVRPTLIGGATKLPFLWVLLGILGGVETFGLLGLFLGPAIMAALILLWREWVGDAPRPLTLQPPAPAPLA